MFVEQTLEEYSQSPLTKSLLSQSGSYNRELMLASHVLCFHVHMKK